MWSDFAFIEILATFYHPEVWSDFACIGIFAVKNCVTDMPHCVSPPTVTCNSQVVSRPRPPTRKQIREVFTSSSTRTFDHFQCSPKVTISSRSISRSPTTMSPFIPTSFNISAPDGRILQVRFFYVFLVLPFELNIACYLFSEGPIPVEGRHISTRSHLADLHLHLHIYKFTSPGSTS